MDHVELFCSILASESQDGELATWVLGKEICHIQDLACDYDPTIRFGCVFGNLFQSVGRHSWRQLYFSSSSTSARSDHSDDSIWCIFRNHIRRVYHVELLRGISARKGQDCKLAAWMLREEICYVENLSVDNDPTITLRGMLGYLFQC